MEFRENQAIYLQIAEAVCDNILSGKWKEGDKIPSIREIAVDFEVNPNTVVRTYAYLQERGIIYNQRGIGYFVAESARKHTGTLKKEEFIQEELPRVFRTMDLLAMDFSDLQRIYETRK